MIAQIKGIVDSKTYTYLIINTSSGVGYKININNTEKYELGTEVVLYIYHKQTEKDDSLWGFDSFREFLFSEILTEVKGIGIKIAQTLITNLGYENLAVSITNKNIDGIIIPGVGPKTAKNIVAGLAESDTLKTFVRNNISESNSKSIKPTSALEEAIAALESLGYKNLSIQNGVQNLSEETTNSDTQTIIKALLRAIK